MWFSITPSCMIFTDVAQNRPARPRSRSDQILHLLDATVPVPPQGSDDPRGKLPERANDT